MNSNQCVKYFPAKFKWLNCYIKQSRQQRLTNKQLISNFFGVVFHAALSGSGSVFER